MGNQQARRRKNTQQGAPPPPAQNNAAQQPAKASTPTPATPSGAASPTPVVYEPEVVAAQKPQIYAFPVAIRPVTPEPVRKPKPPTPEPATDDTIDIPQMEGEAAPEGDNTLMSGIDNDALASLPDLDATMDTVPDGTVQSTVGTAAHSSIASSATDDIYQTVDTTGRPKTFKPIELPISLLPLEDVVEDVTDIRSHFNEMDDLATSVEGELKHADEHLKALQDLIGSADIQGFISLYQRLNKTEATIRVKATGGEVDDARELLPKRDECFSESLARAGTVIETLEKLIVMEGDRAKSVSDSISKLEGLRSEMTGLTMADMVLKVSKNSPVESQSDRPLEEYLSTYRDARAQFDEKLGPTFTKTNAALKALTEALEEEKEAILAHPDVFYNNFEAGFRVVTGVERYAAKLKRENATRNLQHTQALHRKCLNVKIELDRVVKEREEVEVLKAKYRKLSGELLADREKYIDMAAELERLKLREDDKEREERTSRKLLEQGETIQKKAADLESMSARLSELSLGHHPELLCDKDKTVSNSVRATGLVSERKLADYQNVEMLSTGSNHVFSALFADERVVLKQLPVLDKKALENEVRLLHKLRHPHVIELRTVFYEGLYAYLEMPFMEKGSMKEWLVASNPSEAGLQNTFRHILQGVAYLHDRHVIHRDLNFSNILINGNDHPVICDFGISKEQSVITQTQVARTAVIGTQGFMAPEVEAGQRAKTACDVWAVGIMIYHAHFKDGPPPIPEKGQVNIPKHENTWLRDLLTHMLKVDPSQRPSAATLLTHPYFSTQLQNQLYKNLVKRDRDIEFFQEHLTTVTGRTTAPATIFVKYETVVESVLKSFSALTEESMAVPIALDFTGDIPRSDDVYTVFFQEILSTRYGLFECASDDPTEARKGPGEAGPGPTQRALAPNSPLYLPSPHAADLHAFEMVGRVLLKLLIDKTPAPVPFARSVYQHLMGRKLDITDLDLYNRELSLRLRELLATPQVEMKVQWPGRDGDEWSVNDNNKTEYVNAVIQDELVTKRKPQLDALRKGFQLIPLSNWLTEVTTTDVVILVSGSGHVDVGMVLEHLQFSPNPSEWAQQASTVADFKAFLAELRPRDLRRFLYLVSGSAYIPAGGFREPSTSLPCKLTVQQSDESQGVNRDQVQAFAPDYLLLVPDFHHPDILSEKLMEAIYHA